MSRTSYPIHGEDSPRPTIAINAMLIKDAALATNLSADEIRGLRDSDGIQCPIPPTGLAIRVYVATYEKPDGSRGFGLLRALPLEA